MLKTLIEELERTEIKLIKIKNEGCVAEYLLPHERCRSLTNMVNILSSLVYKTTHNRIDEEDLALSQDEHKNTDDELMFSKLSSSEEFLDEVKRLLKSKTESNSAIHIYLSSFIELLGDLVFSICEINNFKMKLASGITVKDLVTIKNLYSTLWELLFSLFHPNSATRDNTAKTQRKETQEVLLEENMVVLDLVNTLESCLKEMSKVKVDIEHYIKFNLIEIQFERTEDETGLATEESVTNDKSTQYLKSEEYGMNRQNNSEVPSQDFPENKQHNMPTNRAGCPKDNFSSSVFPQNIEGWDNCQDYKFYQDSYGHFLNGPIIYPPDVLFFDPPTVVFKSQMEPTRENSLPKIYSVDSINDDNQSNTSRGNSTDSVSDKDQAKNYIPEDCRDSTHNVTVENTPLQIENEDEDLFGENTLQGKEEYIQLKEKLSSLLTLLKTNKLSDTEDIFDSEPWKTQERDSSSSQKPKDKKLETKIKKRKNAKSNYLVSKIKELQNKNTEQQGLYKTSNEYKKSIVQPQFKQEKHKSLLKQERLYMDYPMEFWAPTEEMIYDDQSIIELFKSNPRECDNAESVPTQESAFCLWPVAAEYVYVSRSDEGENCHSVKSRNSVLLGKSFEQSFYSLQMNRKYEQKQLYDGDLIVLDRKETGLLQNKRTSAASLCNKSTYDEYDTIENRDLKRLHPRNCADGFDVRDGNKMPFHNPLVSTDHGGIHAQQRTYEVRYADCADSILVGNNFKKEKINFFNFNSYNESHNWDSFISIMTSKVGPNTQINEQRMFRKIVKNLGPDSLQSNNRFDNVHTLTSSGGPFRLFDINGYPLTDSEGNVLKDPYGKCLVDLDSTGFPKDDIKVFDAAGNSPKDVKFDPTQKPQSNCVVVKLTDNFKRPLHLFDKYGRPLTDSSGKLLVNIHGRPLLRFDNFGRPNTDYRGGPLYTDNGFRWSFKTQSLSNEQTSDETLSSQKRNLQNESTKDASICTDTTDEKPKCDDNCGLDQTKTDNFAHINTRNSEMWLQVESVLRYLSRKTKVEEKPSQARELVSSTPPNSNMAEKEYLDSIIYHDVGTRECVHYSDRDNYQIEENNTEQGDRKIENSKVLGGYNIFLDGKITYDRKNDVLNANFPVHLHDNIKIKRTLSKDIISSKIQEINRYIPSIFLENNVCKDPQDLLNERLFRKTRLMDMSLYCPTNITNVTPPIFNLKDHERVNNLCNQILKNKIESRFKLRDTNFEMYQTIPEPGRKKENLTDTTDFQTLSDFTSSLVSKYTNDIPLYTDSPAASVESQKKDSQIIKILEDIDCKFRKRGLPKNISNVREELRGESGVQVALENNNNKDKSLLQKTNRFKDRSYQEYIKEILESSGKSGETNMYIDVVNKGANQYQINVKERMRTGFQSKGHDYFGICTDNKYITNDIEYPEREKEIIKHNIPEKQQISPTMNHAAGVYHGEFCRHFKHEKNKSKDSPFRFPSEDRMETTIAMNKNIDYVHGENWPVQDRNRNNKKHEKETHNEFVFNHHNHTAAKHEHLYPKLKKPQRDCNLVSFLGSPVKYVLNKLDTKRSLRQDGKEKKHKYLKTINEPAESDKIVKTLYSKGHKKYVTSTETNTESKSGQRHGRVKKNLLAFKSKSFSEVPDSKVGHMSYSGSQETSDKYSPESSSQYNKCSSDTVVASRHKHIYPQRKSRRGDAKKLRKEQYSFETHYVHTSNTTNHNHRSDKSPRGHYKHTSKSPKNKTRTMKLFKKAGQTSKQKRTR